MAKEAPFSTGIRSSIAEAPIGNKPEPHPAKSRLGFLQGQIPVPDQFDRIGDEEIIALFEGPR